MSHTILLYINDTSSASYVYWILYIIKYVKFIPKMQ